MKNNSKNIGMNIALKRRFSELIIDDTSFSNYTVFGNFDAMDIDLVDNWNDFSPESINKKAYNGHEFLDKYYIKLLFPNDIIQNALSEDKGADYDYWKSINDCTRTSKHFYGLLLLSLPKKLVDRLQPNYLPEEYVFTCLFDSYIKSRSASHEEARLFFKDNHFSVYNTLGYFDAAVLFNANDLSVVLHLINSLKSDISVNTSLILAQKSVNNQNEERLLSTDNEDVTLSVRIKTKPGVKLFDCTKSIDEYFRGKYRLNYVYGNSDLLMIPNLPINEFVAEYLTNGFFNSGSDFMKKFVRNIHSTIRVRNVLQNTFIDTAEEEDDSLPKNEIQRFNSVISRLQAFQQNYGLSGRLVSGWKELINLYQESITYSFTFDIKRIMQESLDVALHCVNSFIEEYAPKDNVEEHYRVLHCFENAISRIKNYFSDYLKSISFSDLHLMDGSAFPHPAGIFATKLLFAYNQIVRKLAAFVTKYDEETTSETKYSFLVISGNCDETKILDPFYFCETKTNREGNILDEKKPFIIKIPENNLYLVKATIFHLFHESLHHCGNRKRVKRFELMLKFVCRIISSTIANFVIYGEEDLIEIIDMLLEVDENTVKPIFALRDKYIGRLTRSIYGILFKQVQQYCVNLKYSDLLLHKIERSISDLLTEILSIDGIKNSCFIHIYNKTIDYTIKLLKSLKSLLVPNQDIFSRIDLEISKVEFEAKRNHAIAYDNEIYNKVYYVINSIIGNAIDVSLLDGIARMNGDPDNSPASNLNLINEFLTVSDVVETATQGFKECYSDVVSIILLDISVEDYLMSFIADNNSEIVFINSSYNTIRINSVLKNIYGIKSIFSLNKYKLKVKEKYMQSGLKEQDFDEIWKYLCLMMNDYLLGNDCKDLDEYIRIIKEEYNNYVINDDIKEVIELYKGLDNSDDVEWIVEYIYRFWGELSNE